MTRRWHALELLDLVLDAGSFVSWDSPVDQGEVSAAYAAQLERAQERSGVDESVVTGRGRVRGRDVAVVVNEFGFLAGSIGQAAAGRIVSAVRRATAEGLPLLASTASGGTRMQEGTPAFVRMIEISRALMAHRAARLPYLAHLRHPTTGGVFASWGSLAHLTVAEPGALVGFLGPKVYEALNDAPFPEGVQTAENLTAHGILDAVVPAEALSGLIDNALAVLVDDPTSPALATPRLVEDTDGLDRLEDLVAWDHITRSREPGRAGVRDLLRVAGRRHRADARHRRGRARQRRRRRPDPSRRPAVRRGGPGPLPAVPGHPDGPGGATTGPSRDPVRRGARPTAGHRDRHPGRRAVPGRRGGRDRR